MAQSSRSTDPLDVLQRTLDSIFIDIGKSLRISDRATPKILAANANVRLRAAIPRAVETFHQALDEIETEVVRAKAVFLRDLEEARAKRIALENPPPEVVQEQIKLEPTPDVILSHDTFTSGTDELAPLSAMKEEDTDMKSLEASVAQDLPKDAVAKDSDNANKIQGPSPPISNDVKPKSDDVGLDQNNSSVTDTLGTAGMAEESIDSLLDISAGNNHDDLDINFYDVDFPALDSNTGETSQSQSNDLDFATFGNNLQGFQMPDMTSSNIESSNNNTEGMKDDLYEMANNTDEDVMMSMGFIGNAEESSFDDMFLIADGDVGGDSSMEHGGYDDKFFGL